MGFIDSIRDLNADSIMRLANIKVGITAAYDKATNMAVIHTVGMDGSSITTYKIPWPLPPAGYVVSAPKTIADGDDGTQVLLGFREANSEYPVILSVFDPFYAVERAIDDKRDLMSYSTKTDKTIISEYGSTLVNITDIEGILGSIIG